MTDIKQPVFLQTIGTKNEPVNVLAFSPDSSSIYYSSDKTIIHQKIDSKDEPVIYEGHKEPVTSLCVGTEFFISSSIDSTVKLWKLEGFGCTNKEELLYSVHTDVVNCLDLCPDEKQFCSASNDKTIRLWSTTHSRRLAKFLNKKAVYCAKFAKLTPNLLSSCGMDGSIKLWDLRTTDMESSLSTDIKKIYNLLAWSPKHCHILASACLDNIVHIWDLRNCELLQTFKLDGGKITCIDFHPSGLYLIISQHDAPWKVVDVTKNEFICKQPLTSTTVGQLNCIQFSTNGKYFATAGETVSLYEFDFSVSLSDIKSQEIEIPKFSEASEEIKKTEDMIVENETNPALNPFELALATEQDCPCLPVMKELLTKITSLSDVIIVMDNRISKLETKFEKFISSKP